MFTRPPSSPRMAILKPSPSAPSRFATGTAQASKLTVQVGCECQPSLRSCLPKPRPAVPFSTTMALIPSGPSPPVRHITT